MIVVCVQTRRPHGAGGAVGGAGVRGDGPANCVPDGGTSTTCAGTTLSYSACSPRLSPDDRRRQGSPGETTIGLFAYCVFAGNKLRLCRVIA